ncbi:hypothetical protein R2R35_20350 [Anaerocolumna sp. AGMB13020]|uniref:hypothetical protein n=1 Tax=Anaerocolumna sp. AGMB13020 TaxID=3081750 RepID=UPI0029535588|nr:hypothetical protein [Anaerocolumna sp. AGMB13020]WOO36126.1 hypothetical protein R2R35_20350 [Anaerocolumna sp. AGMB13020]
MYSDLRKLSNLFLVFSLLSLGGSAFSFIMLFDYWHLRQTDFKPFFYICSFLSAAIPLVFICLTVMVRKMVKELITDNHYITEQLRTLEAKMEQLSER